MRVPAEQVALPFMKSYLYTQSDIRAHIEAFRTSQQMPKRQCQSIPSERTEAGKEMLLAAKERRIKTLEEENRQLNVDLKKALGRIYDRI